MIDIEISVNGKHVRPVMNTVICCVYCKVHFIRPFLLCNFMLYANVWPNYTGYDE